MNKSILHLWAVATLSVFLAACATPEQIAKQEAETYVKNKAAMMASIPEGSRALDGAELQRLLPNKTSVGISTRSGNPYKVFYTPKGELEGIAGHSYEYSDSGKWEVSNDQMCSQWSSWRDGNRKCWWFAVNSDNSYIGYAEKWGNEFKLLDGKQL